MKYYKFLSNTVDISGTEEEELFEIKDRGKYVKVSVFRMKNNKANRKIYERVFDEKDTRFINLAGLGGNDHFRVDENTSSGIIIKIAGGEGKDVYDIKSKLKARIYDSLSDNNKVINDFRVKNSFLLKLTIYKWLRHNVPQKILLD